MFTADPRFLSENPLLKEVLKHSVFMQLVGRPPILGEEFRECWLVKVESMTDKVLARWYFFPDLAYSVEVLRKLDGYERLKEKLLQIDNEFFAIVSQMEFSAFLVEKNSPISVSLESCFSTRSNKHPDVRVKMNDKFYYFEVTKVLDYESLISVTSLQHTLATFLEGFRRKREISISVDLFEPPDQVLVLDVLRAINDLLLEGKYDVRCKQEKFEVSITEGSKELRIYLPSEVSVRKLRDKLFEECEQFDRGERNIVVLDVTSMVEQFETYGPIVRQFFDDEANDLVSCVILFKKDFFIEENEIKRRIGFCIIPNKYAKTSQNIESKIDDMLCRI